MNTPDKTKDGKEITHVTCTVATPTARLAREFRKYQRNIIVQTNEYSKLIEKRLDADHVDPESVDPELDTNDEGTYQTLFDQAALVLNIPNAEDGTPRTAEDINWDDSDLLEVRKGLNVFSDRLSGSTSDTKS